MMGRSSGSRLTNPGRWPTTPTTSRPPGFLFSPARSSISSAAAPAQTAPALAGRRIAVDDLEASARHHPADGPEFPISGPPPICQLRAHDADCRPSRRRKASRAGALPTRPGVRTGTADMGAACDALHLTVSQAPIRQGRSGASPPGLTSLAVITPVLGSRANSRRSALRADRQRGSSYGARTVFMRMRRPYLPRPPALAGTIGGRQEPAPAYQPGRLVMSPPSGCTPDPICAPAAVRCQVSDARR